MGRLCAGRLGKVGSVSLSSRLVGMHYRYPDYYEVDREQIRQYALAVKNRNATFLTEDAAAQLGYDSLPAPLTFTSMFGYKAQLAFFHDANIALEEVQIVQVDQVLKYFKPIKAGMRLYCDVYVDSVRQAHGVDIIVLKSVVTDDRDELVQETYTTLAGRSGEQGQEGFTDCPAPSGSSRRSA